MSFLDKLRTQKLLSFTLVLFTLSVGIVIGTLITSSGVRAAKDAQVAPGATELKIPSPVELSTAFSQIAKTLEPSVVNISTTYFAKTPTTSRGRGQRRQVSPFGDDQGDSDSGNGNGNGMEDFFRFFGNPFGQGMPDLPNRNREALGSGVVVDKAGYILTNNHVVDKADQIKVKFSGDPTQYDAKVVGVDEQTDLAVIRVEGKTNLTPAKIGNSDAVQVGDWAVAIGSPFGFQATVTAGIISARERDVPGDTTQYQHFLQTDAAINPGNSGGPLLNARGEVIGINTAIASRSGSYEGIGFALPINTAAEVYNQIIKNGKVTRGSIGITFPPSDRPEARANLKVAGVGEGVFVQSVAPGGPAEKAGIEPGDVIVALNGKPVREGNDLVNPITATPVGTTVTLGVMRDGKRQDFKVTTGDITQIFPDRFGDAGQQGAARPEGITSKFGMDIQNMTDQWRQANGVKQAGGVRIVSVKPDSFAEEIRLEPGDILLAINRTPVNSVEEVNRVQANLKPGDAVQLRVLRRNERNGDWTSMFVAGMLPNSPQ
jgi:serine protease Do